MNFRWFHRRSDLPLKDDATSRFLPWLVALMVFLSALAIAGVFVLTALIHRWDHDVSGTLTVQVQPATASNNQEAERRTDQRVEDALRLIRDIHGIESARALDKTQLLGLLEPWLGKTDLLQDLPLPRLIDVSVDADAGVDLGDLSDRLAKAVPGASLDDHRMWLSRLINLSRTIQWLSTAIVLVIGVVTGATVVYATRTGMAIHREVIEVMHIVGARDDYIARQFAGRAFDLGLRGGFLGLGMAIPALIAIHGATRRMEGGFLPDLTLSFWGWVTILFLPLLAALTSMVTARVTVHGTINRLP